MPTAQPLPHQEKQNLKDKATEKRIRLHITPLDPSLLQTYISVSLLSQATNISYHQIESFPEKNYGYVELPAMEAEKLKKKLNGSVLKGNRVKIEDAKPDSRKKRIAQEAEEDAEGSAKNKERSSKKRKREEGVLPGVALPEGRKVKRGWTEPEEKSSAKERKRKKKDKEREGKTEKKRAKSKYTNEPELLFRAKLPSTKESKASPNDVRKKKKKHSKKDDAIVHEFAKTKKHKHPIVGNDNVRHSGLSHYEEGAGWVNVDGQIVEPEPKSHKNGAKEVRATRSALNITTQFSSPKEEQMEPAPPKSSGSTTSGYLQSPGTQLRGELNQALAGAQSMSPRDNSDRDDDASDSKSRSNASEDSGEGGEENELEIDESEELELPDNRSSPNDINNSGIVMEYEEEIRSDTERTSSQAPAVIKTEPETESVKDVHPLEALYKRPKPNPDSPKKPTPIQTDFTFFGADEEEEKDELGALPVMPQTPFTRQDLEFRGIRSAAPTPDTAAIGKKFIFPWSADGEDDNEEAEDVEDADGDVNMVDQAEPVGEATNVGPAGTKATAHTAKEPKEESEFEKWFWEHRGETNRAWKKRRREAMKEKRHRENRRLNRRIV